MSLWTPDANAQALAVSAAIAAAREDGREQIRAAIYLLGAQLTAQRGRVRRAQGHALLRIAAQIRKGAPLTLDDAPAIAPDSPADPDTTWSHRDSGA